MNRKTLSLLVLMLMLSMVLAACPAAAPAPGSAAATPAPGGESAAADSGERSVTFMGAATMRAHDENAIAYCEEQTGISVEVVNGPESATDRLALYLQFFGAGSGDIDAMQIDVIWPGILAEHLVDLRPYLSDEQFESYFERIANNNTVDGQLVGIPWFTDAGLLYYRTDLLEEYGFDGPPVTWADLEEMATTIQEGQRAENSDFWGFVWQGAAYEGLTCDALEWQFSWNGGTIVEPDGTISINNPEAAAAFDMAASWVGNISPPGVVSYMEEDARGVWQAGNAAFMRNWPYAFSLGNAEGSEIAGKFAVMPLPKGGADGQNADTLGGWQMAVSRYSDDVDAAAEFAVCMTSYEAQKIRAVEGSMLPTIGDLYFDEDVLEAQPFFGQLYDVFAGGAVARPSTVTGEDYNQVSTIYFTEVNKVLTGQQTGQQAVESIEQQLQALLGR
jgi:trehalose/maltose transport system substrate-binding protein